jgi:esterase
MMAEDEMSLLASAADELGMQPPRVTRLPWHSPRGELSGLLWGAAPPELVLLHGGGQNAHTWDETLLRMQRTALAIDLPGHGHSEWLASRHYAPREMASDIAGFIAEVAIGPVCLVGMSLGGLIAIRLAAILPGLIGGLVLVDVTPSIRSGHEPGPQPSAVALIGGPKVYPSFVELTRSVTRAQPHRAPSGLRRSLLYNARELPDGTWVWRYDQAGLADLPDRSFQSLWTEVDSVQVPALLVRGEQSPYVRGEHATRFLKGSAHRAVVTVGQAGHSVQGDNPEELARILGRFVTDHDPLDSPP